MWCDPGVGKIPWRRKWQPTPASLPGKLHGQRSLVNCSPWGHKESDTTMTEWLTHEWILGNIKKRKKKLFQLPHILRLKSKESAHNEGDRGDIGLTPGSGRFLWRKKMATHSSILAWKIPWMEEPGRLHGVAQSWTRLSDQELHTEVAKGQKLSAISEYVWKSDVVTNWEHCLV